MGGILLGLFQGGWWNPKDTLISAVATLLGIFKDFLVFILDKTILPLLTNVMSYQNFFSTGVNAGWTVTRDFSNLFFALILLIIAIATVLQVGALDNYTAKRMLPNFIFVALFINFSKAIVGFLIDISQIIMVSLYNSFGPTMANTIGNASKIAEAGKEAGADVNVIFINIFTIVIVAFLAFILLWTALILAMRIVTLWLVIMLAPLAFMSTLIPGLKSISDDWKNKLQDALVTGPTLMFFLYLAFTVMSNGMSATITTAGGDNLINNGNLINYVLVIGLLFLANTTATKAGQAAPPFLQKAVGVAGTVATFGLGAYVGAGGYGTGKMFSKSKELAQGGVKKADQLAGGATNTAGFVGAVTGNTKLKNANQAYESRKKDLLEQQKTGVGFAGRFQGFSAEGKKQKLEDFEKEKAMRLYNQNQLEEKGNERYKKIASTLQATAATEVKDEYNVEKLGKQMEAALEEGDKFTAMAIATRISELKGWNKIFTEGKYSDYSDPSNGYDTDAKQLDAFINDNFEIKDSAGAVIDSSKTINSFRSRQANILNDKGAGNFAAGLAERDVSDPALSPSTKASKAGLVGAGAMVAKNNSIFNRKNKVTDSSTGREIYEDYFDINQFAPIIANESSIDTLEDPKSWNQYGGIRANIIKEIENYLSLYKSDPAVASATYKELSKVGEDKLKAALKGLGSKAYSRVTGGTI
jgi:hypothetical protein